MVTNGSLVRTAVAAVALAAAVLTSSDAGSPDMVSSEEVAFISNRDGDRDGDGVADRMIYVINAHRGDERRLTTGGYDEQDVASSPDRSRIALTRSSAGTHPDLYILSRNSEMQLTKDSTAECCPSWSPDGKSIAFTGIRTFTRPPPCPVHGGREFCAYGNVDIYVISLDNREEKRLTVDAANDSAPTWSADGEHIAFQSERDGNVDVYVMKADGSDQTRLTTHESYDGQPAWSPDGTRIAFTSERSGHGEIYDMRVDGSMQRALTTDGGNNGNPSWSPDGEWLVFDSGRDRHYEIYRMAADGSNQTRLVQHPAADFRPRWYN